MTQQVLICRKPSPSYSIFLYEQLALFTMKALEKGRPYKIHKFREFLETFNHASIKDQHLLCELYLHHLVVKEDRLTNITPIVGDIQLRAFTYFVNNQFFWRNAFLFAQQNEQSSTLWVRGEPLDIPTYLDDYQEILSWEGMSEHIQNL